MELVSTIREVREVVKQARLAGKRIGLVPTMGYLHEGHLALMRQAQEECDFVVVSVFVNPLQFGPDEDYDQYPRDIEHDRKVCETVPVDLIFHPSPEEMYPEPFLTGVKVSTVTEGLCGVSRPGHFDGVATVVTKLFNIIKPDRAYFGQKDAQQVAVVRRLVADLNLDVEIRPVPTARDADGLARSSRNVYLSPQQRQAALVLSRSLKMAQEEVAAGQRDMVALTAAMRDMIAKEPLASIDYVQIVNYDTLQPLNRLETRALAAVAVKFGSTRLIDNCVLEVPK